jgi:hypothetical protein
MVSVNRSSSRTLSSVTSGTHSAAVSWSLKIGTPVAESRSSEAGTSSNSTDSPKISQVLPLLYLRGLSSDDFVPTLEQFLGSTAGLSPAPVTRLATQW